MKNINRKVEEERKRENHRGHGGRRWRKVEKFHSSFLFTPFSLLSAL
jgi:hypothetical protein